MTARSRISFYFAEQSEGLERVYPCAGKDDGDLWKFTPILRKAGAVAAWICLEKERYYREPEILEGRMAAGLRDTCLFERTDCLENERGRSFWEKGVSVVRN